MPKINETLEEALLKKGFDTKSFLDEKDVVLDKGNLEKVASAWKNNETGIVAVIQSRMDAIAIYLAYRATPVEVAECRKALAELGEIKKDFEKYVIEYDKRNKGKEEGKEETEPEGDVPEGEESSL